jgi:cupin fold WbuC family metalloprotein
MFAMPITVKSAEVHQAEGGVIAVSVNEVAPIRAGASANARKRARLCTHPGPHDLLHEMIIALDRATYVRPHRHQGKSESFHMIEGEVDVVIFHDDGRLREVLPLGIYGSGKVFFYRLQEAAFHSVLIRSPVAVFHETTNGPFVREETEFASWAPEEGTTEAAEYLAKLRALVG